MSKYTGYQNKVTFSAVTWTYINNVLIKMFVTTQCIMVIFPLESVIRRNKIGNSNLTTWDAMSGWGLEVCGLS